MTDNYQTELNYQLPGKGYEKHIFMDLDETLIHYSKLEDVVYTGPYVTYGLQGRLMFLRPEAHRLLSICRQWADKVVMCTFAGDVYACLANEAFALGFQKDEMITVELLSVSKEALGPEGILIDNLPVSHENTMIKMHVLGIDGKRLIQIPEFVHPEFVELSSFLDELPGLLDESLATESSQDEDQD